MGAVPLTTWRQIEGGLVKTQHKFFLQHPKFINSFIKPKRSSILWNVRSILSYSYVCLLRSASKPRVMPKLLPECCLGGKRKGKKIINLFSFKGQISGQKRRDGRHYGTHGGKRGQRWTLIFCSTWLLIYTFDTLCLELDVLTIGVIGKG